MKTRLIDRSKTGIETYLLENATGMSAQVITYGARVQKLFVQDSKGEFIDVVAGFDGAEEYRDDHGTYFGAVVGRVANRIGGAKFTLDGKEYSLYKNDGENHLHGGKEGFDKKIWQVAELGEGKIKLFYLSVDKEENYPANLKVYVTYTLTDDNALLIEYEAESDGTTLCSLTNHSYFDLSGKFESVRGHRIFINSDAVTAVDAQLIPHGDTVRVKDTAFDFNATKELGKDIDDNNPLLKNARGYDINYVLNNDGKSAVASAYCGESGIKMSVYTDRPCMQLYSGNFLDGFKGKKVYPYQSAFCMETQGYPNACNVKEFCSIELKTGEKYRTYTKYAFERI